MENAKTRVKTQELRWCVWPIDHSTGKYVDRRRWIPVRTEGHYIVQDGFITDVKVFLGAGETLMWVTVNSLTDGDGQPYAPCIEAACANGCGKKLAYPGAIYCGAACCALAEANAHRPTKEG